jgi:hypothetical protein
MVDVNFNDVAGVDEAMSTACDESMGNLKTRLPKGAVYPGLAPQGHDQLHPEPVSPELSIANWATRRATVFLIFPGSSYRFRGRHKSRPAALVSWRPGS